MSIAVLSSGALGLSAFLLSLLDGRYGTGIVTGILVAAIAGAVAAFGHRVIAGVLAAGLIARGYDLGLAEMRPAHIAPILLLLIATFRHVSAPSLPAWSWALFPVSATALVMASYALPLHPVPTFLLLTLAGAIAALGGLAGTQHVLGENAAETAREALGDRRWLTETARFLLLGRISSGMSHELSQALNVITMANGNLGYILDRAEISDPHGQQLTERVRRIAANAEAAAQMLGQYRWFGQDGGREGHGELTVGTALAQAAAATKAAARKSGVTVEIRGDALPHSLPLRHGTIEMMTTVALLEVIQMLAARPIDGPPPDPILLEATTSETDIRISVICASADPAQGMEDDDIAQATYELLAKLAVSCRCELRRVKRKRDPVRFELRLDRDVV